MQTAGFNRLLSKREAHSFPSDLPKVLMYPIGQNTIREVKIHILPIL